MIFKQKLGAFLFVSLLFLSAIVPVVSAQSQIPDSQADPTITAEGVIAPGGGFVPCSGITCDLCDFMIMANTIIKWLFAMAFLFFAVIAVKAGVGLVTSGGNSGAKQAAKQAFQDAFIGLIIFLCAWLLVDTLLRAILNKGDTGEIEGWGPWSQVKCATQAQSQIKEGFFEGDPEYFASSPETEGLFGNYVAVNQNPGSCSPATTGACSAGSLAAFGGLANNAATILAAESKCNPNAESGTDRTTDNRTYSVGLWQINLTQHPIICNGERLNCPSAFRATGQRHPKYKTRMYEVVDNGMYQRCVAAAKNPQCNSAVAAGLVQKAGNFKDWACSAKKCGISTPLNNKCPVPGI